MHRRLLLAAPVLLAGFSLLGGDPSATGPGNPADWAARRERALELAGADKGMREAVDRVLPEGKPPQPDFIALSNASFYARKAAEAAEIVSWFLDHEDPKFRLKAAAFLAGHWSWRSSVFPLAELLKDPSPAVRSEAAFALAHLFLRHHQERRAEGPLDFWTRERDRPEVRWVFAEPLPLPDRRPEPAPEIPEERAEGLEALVRQLGADLMEDRDEAERRILKLAERAPRQVMAAIARDHEDPEIAMRAETLRPRIHVQAARRRALDAAKPDPKLREEVEKAFASQEGMHRLIRASGPSLEGSVGILEILLDHPDGWVVASVIGRAQEARLRELAPRIRAIMIRGGDCRFPATRALAEMRDAGSRVEMERLLADPDAQVRRMAANALGDIGDPAAAPRLARLLSESDPQVSQEAAEALWRLWSRAWLVPRLAPLLEDQNQQVMVAVSGLFAAMEPELRAQGQPGIVELRRWWGAHKDDPDFKAPGGPAK